MAHSSKTTWHSLTMGVAVAALLGACGGQSTTDQPPAESDAAGTNTDPGGDGARGDGAPGELDPAPCVAPPAGTWKLTYETSESACPGAGGVTELTLAQTAQGLAINYGCAQAAPSCGVSSFDAATCSVKTKVESRWVASGEPQCESRDLTLFFHGDSAEGSMIYQKCWCPSYPPLSVNFRVRAVRQ